MKRRSIALLSIGLAAVVVIGAGIAIWLLSRPAGPEQTAAAYLAAIESGDGPAALATLTPSADAATTTAFEGATSFAAAGSVGDSVAGESADAATIRLSFTLDGAAAEVTLTLKNTDAGWRITDGGLGEVSLATTLGDSVRVGDALLEVAQPPALLPGVYPVAAAPTGILEGTASLTVVPGTVAAASVTAVPSASAAALADTQLSTYLAHCTEPADAVPPRCGIRVPWAADLTSLTAIAFRIETSPTLALSADGRRFAATGGVLVATARGPSRSGGEGSFTYRADDWAVRGSIAYLGDEMVLAVD